SVLSKKALTLLLCRGAHIDPPSVLELQEKIRARRPLNISRTIYMCRISTSACTASSSWLPSLRTCIIKSKGDQDLQ
ncbi:hypothetical protein ElyMa_002208900, partial [Elysia marginata]